MKRITWWPQAWLGLVFSWGALVGWPAVTGRLGWPPFLLWFGSIAWVVGYDTLYAIQDIEDDALVGVKSSARRLGDKAPLGVAFSTRSRCCCGARRSGRCGPDWLALARAGSRRRFTSPTRRFAPTPSDGELALRLFRSNRDLRPAGVPRHAGRRPFRALGARAMLSRTTPAESPNRWSSAASPPARPPPTPSTSASARRACRSASASSRTSAAPKARRSACGCSSASARRPSPRPTCPTRRSATLVERCLAMAREAPEDPYAGLAPRELLQRGELPDARRATIGASPIRPSFARARWRPRRRRSPLPGVTNSSGAGASASAIDRRARHLGRLLGRLSRPPATAARPASSPAKARRCSATTPGTARAISTTSTPPRRSAGAPASARSRGSNPTRPKPGNYPVLFDPRVVVDPARPFRRRDQRLVDRPQDQLPPGQARRRRCSRAGVTIIDDPLRPRGLRSRPFDGEGVRVSRQELVADGILNSWIAESASARQLGIAPTGHAARGVGGAPGAAPSNLYHGRGRAQPRRSCSPPFPKRC